MSKIKEWLDNISFESARKGVIVFIAAVAIMAVAYSVFGHDESECACNEPPPPSGELACLESAFEGPVGTLKKLRIPVEFTGRITAGDLDGDGTPDIVVARRNTLIAYNVCGEQLWKRPTRANWNVHNEHPYWNWSSFGWIGDINGDGRNEYMNIMDDWRTLRVRNAVTGAFEVDFDLGPGVWQYVTVGKVNGSPRVFVTARPGVLKIKSFDFRNGRKVEWSVDHGKRLLAYIPPQVADINADGSDDVYHGAAAVNGKNGSLLWRHSFGGFGLGGAQSGTVKDVHPGKKGLETVVSVYGPKSKSEPSLLIIDANGNIKKSWHDGDHPHQHTIGDFQPGRPGLETFARHGDGKSHWLIDIHGNVLANNVRLNSRGLNSRWGMDWGNFGGEIIQAIDWDGDAADELLYVERHMNLRNIPMLAIAKNKFLTRAFHGGIDVSRTDPNSLSWYGPYTHGGGADHKQDGPYEGAAHVVDMIGDGREEVIALAHNQIVIYYNSGNANVPKKWGDHDYMTRKKLWGHVYGPR